MNHLSTNSHSYLTCEILQLLKDAKVVTILDFLNCESKHIEKITSLTLREILDVRKEFLKMYSRPRSAYSYYQSILSDIAIIPTGIKRLDSLLDGGLFTGNIYEICGLPASGKTLFCFTLLKNVAPKTISDILYLDTKCDFSGLKMKQLFSGLKKEDIIPTMNKIQVTEVRSKGDFLKRLLEIKYSIQNGELTKLIIIDSLPPLVFLSTDQTENNAFLSYTANILHYLAKEYNVVFVVTNLITLWNDGNFKTTDVMKERISCGGYWYGIPNVRISLKKNNNTCNMKLLRTIKFIPKVDSCDIQFSDEGFL